MRQHDSYTRFKASFDVRAAHFYVQNKFLKESDSKLEMNKYPSNNEKNGEASSMNDFRFLYNIATSGCTKITKKGSKMKQFTFFDSNIQL